MLLLGLIELLIVDASYLGQSMPPEASSEAPIEQLEAPLDTKLQVLPFVIEGSVIVVGEVNTVEITAGDYVIFPKGLKCVWEVSQAIKKHYTFE